MMRLIQLIPSASLIAIVLIFAGCGQPAGVGAPPSGATAPAGTELTKTAQAAAVQTVDAALENETAVGTATPLPTDTPVPARSRPTPSTYSIVERKGTISKNETWTFGNIYVVKGDLVVKEGATLTIEPGVIVKVVGGEDGDLHIEGTLKAEGTPEQKIIFTSILDDTAGGDTDNDDGANAPLPGDWDAVMFEDSSSDAESVIRYTEFRYGGGDGSNGVIRLNNASPVLENIGMSNNRINGFSVAEGTWRTNEWLSVGWPYVMSQGEIKIDQRSTLTIGPGVVVKMRGGEDGDFHVEGTLKAEGLPEMPIIFTSIHDDSIGGDTDNDGGANSPLPGDWDAIFFEDNSNDDESIINHAEIRYGGGNGADGSIAVDNASPSLSNITMVDNRINGINPSEGTWKTNQWLTTGVPYVLVEDITVDLRSTLTIGPGVVVKLRGGKDREIFVEGVLHAEGTPEDRIIFTSIHDDSVSGDTDNDGGANSPLSGDWDAIVFKGEVSSQSTLNFVDIWYSSDSPIRTEDSSPSILDVSIER